MKLFGMNKACRAGLTGLALMGFVLAAQTARADTLAVSADLPVAMDLTIKSSGTTTNYSDSSVSGLGVGVSLPFLIGLGYENYAGKFSKSGSKFDYGVSMYDLFINLPIPVVNIALGGGVGTGSISKTNFGNVYKDADLTQWFASLGIPILPLVDVHVGYHAFSGTNKAKSGTGFSDAKASGDMWSLGVKVGF